jgi:outer membrane lipoprotein SlyB
MKKLFLVGLIQSVVAAALMMGGCASTMSSQSFSRSYARTTYDVYYGKVVSIRPVEIEGETSGLGHVGGAAIGYAIGLGNSEWTDARKLRRASAGAVGGAVAGGALESRVGREDELEIVVHLDHDETIAVVQATDVEFSPGQSVQVLFGGNGSSRVQPR